MKKQILAVMVTGAVFATNAAFALLDADDFTETTLKVSSTARRIDKEKKPNKEELKEKLAHLKGRQKQEAKTNAALCVRFGHILYQTSPRGRVVEGTPSAAWPVYESSAKLANIVNEIRDTEAILADLIANEEKLLNPSTPRMETGE